MASASAPSVAPTEAATAITTISRLSEYGILCERLPEVPAKAYDSMIVIKVTESDETKEFQVYRGVLCFYSEFFKRALSERWQTPSASVYEITDTKIAIFEMFFNWMNTGYLLADKKPIDPPMRTVELYKFADFYIIPLLKNHAIEAFFHIVRANMKLQVRSIASIYKYTAQHDLFRKLAVEIAVDSYNFETLPNIENKEHAFEFLKDVIMASRAKNIAPGKGINKPSEGWEERIAKHFCAQYHYHTAQNTEVASEPSANNSSPTIK